jgi:hypothetical protein
MALNVPTVGEVILLQYIVNMVSPTNLVLHLYKNDPTIDDTLTMSSVTEVGAGVGYAPITLIGTSWTTTSPANVGTAVYSEVAFTFTTSQTVYGYYITSTNASTLLWIERFSGAPFTLAAGGGTIAINPKVNLD